MCCQLDGRLKLRFRCALCLHLATQRKNLRRMFSSHTILYFWRVYKEQDVAEINARLVLSSKSYFLFHLFLKSNFIKLLFSVSTEIAVFNYLPRALVIPALIYLTYTWLCVFLFWKCNLGMRHFVIGTTRLCQTLWSRCLEERKEKRWKEWQRYIEMGRERKRERAEVSKVVIPLLSFSIRVELSQRMWLCLRTSGGTSHLCNRLRCSTEMPRTDASAQCVVRKIF